MSSGYKKLKSTPLTEDEINQKYEGIKDEMQEVLNWKKEEEAKLADPKSSPQKKAATKRALKKVAWRTNTVKGQILYWKLRVEGKSHFHANIEKNEFWAECKKGMEK